MTFDAIMYAAERLMEADMPLIIEGNFLPAGIKKTDEAGAIRLIVEPLSGRADGFPLRQIFRSRAVPAPWR